MRKGPEAPDPADRSRAGRAGRRSAPNRLAALVQRLGGRYSTELGLDLHRARDVERWFLAATLFGTRIATEVAIRTWRTLGAAGVHTIGDTATRSWDELVALLDAGGYTRYDFRTATRLQTLAGVVEKRFGGRVAGLGLRIVDPVELERTLDALPGWGPVTVRVFLRELRGIWPGARPPLDPRAAWAARHLGLTRAARWGPADLDRLAHGAGVDPRDAEASLIRAALAHRRARSCPGGAACVVMGEAGPGRPPR